MNNNFTGGSINHGNGWTTTHDPRGDIRHYTGEQSKPTPSVARSFNAGHNSSYTGRHRSGVRGTNRYDMQQKRRGQRERAEAEEACLRHEAEEAQRRHDEEARIRQEQETHRLHEEEIRRKEHGEWMAKHPLEAAEKRGRDMDDHIRHIELLKNHTENQIREIESKMNVVQGALNELDKALAAELAGIDNRKRKFGISKDQSKERAHKLFRELRTPKEREFKQQQD